ncbi:UPF0280 family protein [Plastoroseomonas hellenica]|uniref:UPF0280 family protein n=1 Tax=Plastoroseomonas hellenica TaxID=2687306 RepID=UPI0020131C3B|nr:UPF0280 family protein [Plastoroseomonas hellenica]
MVIGVDAPEAARQAAYARAEHAFTGLIAALAEELPALRAPAGTAELQHPVAQRMAQAVRPHASVFITPMAAVAGAVAEHVLAAIAEDPAIRRAHVNNGGDIALHLAEGESLRIGLVRSLSRATPEGSVTIASHMPVRGIATSGWPGRSFSRGIADAVTVLAARAADADAAATVIANAVDVDHPAIRRAPARSLDPDSDLGDILVTTGVGPLPDAVVAEALKAGAAVAARLRREGLITAALLAIGDEIRVVSDGKILLPHFGRPHQRGEGA